VGKTTLGREVARALRLPFFDLDEMFCDRVFNVRRYIQNHGYPAYARKNGDLLLQFPAEPPGCMVLALSSGVLSSEMPEPLLTTIADSVRADGMSFLITLSDSAEAANLVALRQIRRGHDLTYEPQRRKYLRRITEYRAHGFSEIICQPDSREAVETLLRHIDWTYEAGSAL